METGDNLRREAPAVARDRPEGLWALPWGPMGAVGLLVPLLFGVFSLVELLVVLGVDMDGLGGRYAILGLQLGSFIALPVAVLLVSGGRLADLGLRIPGVRPVLVGALCAPLVLLVVIAYHVVIQKLSPTMMAALEEEVERQADAFAAPLPLLVLAGVVVGPLAEELLFRGFLYGGLRTGLAAWPAALIASGLFALFHMMPAAAPSLFILGLLLARLYERYRSLAVPVVLHGTFNLLVLAVQGRAP